MAASGRRGDERADAGAREVVAAPVALADRPEAAVVMFAVTCDNCGGEGGFYTLTGYIDDPVPGERWDECPACRGAGWVIDDDPGPEIDPDEAFPP